MEKKFGGEIPICVAKGTYYVAKENSLGQFFSRSVPTVYIPFGDEYALVHGGFWIPANTTEEPRAFWWTLMRGDRVKTVAELEAKLQEYEAALTASSGSQPPKNVDVASGTLPITLRSVPAGATPLQAGIGAGLATGLVMAFVGDDPTPIFYPVPPTKDFGVAIRSALTPPPAPSN